MVDLQVGGLSIGALVGHGTSCTLLRLDIFHTLAGRAHHHRLLADAPALRGVSGASLDVRGSTEIKIQGVAKPIRVTVLGVQNGAGRRCTTGWPRHNRFRSKCVEMASKGVANATH